MAALNPPRMSHLESSIEDDRSSSAVDADSGLMIDVDGARVRLTQYELEDPFEFVVRIAQAANLGADWFNIEFGQAVKITLQGWSRFYGVDQIVEAFLSPSVTGSDKAIDYLRVGLLALYGQHDGDVELVLRNAGEAGVHRVQIDAGLTTSFEEAALENLFSTLEIVWPLPGDPIHHSRYHVDLLDKLKRTHLLSRIPICSEGKPLPFLPPPDEVLAWHYFGCEQRGTPAAVMVLEETHPLARSIRAQGEPTGLLELTVHRDPQMRVYLAKAGMIIDFREKESTYKGVVAYLDADDLDTDSTGSKFADTDELADLIDWVEESSKLLLPPAIEKSQQLENEEIKIEGFWVVMTPPLIGLLGIAIFLGQTTLLPWFNGAPFSMEPPVITVTVVGVAIMLGLMMLFSSKIKTIRRTVQEMRQKRTEDLINTQSRLATLALDVQAVVPPPNR